MQNDQNNATQPELTTEDIIRLWYEADGAAEWETTAVAFAHSMLSKLRAEGVQAGDEREAFEKYAARAGYPLTGRELGHYSNIRTRNNWMGWQARAALASAPVADERAAFEVAMQMRGQNIYRWPNPHGGYRNSTTEMAWYAWSDRAALASVPACSEATDADLDKLYRETITEGPNNDIRCWENPHRLYARAVLARYARAALASAPVAGEAESQCANCGKPASQTEHCISEYPEDGEWFCSEVCFEQHGVLDCPQVTHSGYRHPAEAARLIAAENVLRSLASWLGCRGFNRDEVNTDEFEQRIREGVDSFIRRQSLLASAPLAGEAQPTDEQIHRLAFDAGVVFGNTEEGAECWEFESPSLREFALALLSRHSAPQASEADAMRQAMKACGSKVIKALAAIARADGPDTRKADDPELIYRAPVMDEVVRIRQAYGELESAIKTQADKDGTQSTANRPESRASIESKGGALDGGDCAKGGAEAELPDIEPEPRTATDYPVALGGYSAHVADDRHSSASCGDPRNKCDCTPVSGEAMQLVESLRDWHGKGDGVTTAIPDELAQALYGYLYDAADDPLRALMAKHAELLEGSDYAYFELARTRATGWMAWLCSHPAETHPDRKVLARGQGSTPDEACRLALADFDRRAKGE